MNSQSFAVLRVSRTGAILAELPGAVVTQIVWQLNQPETCTIDITPFDPGLTGLVLLKDEIQVWLGSKLLFWGFPVSIRGGFGTITITCDGLLGYFRYRYITNTSLTFPPTGTTPYEQLNIAWQVLLAMQTGSDKDLNIQSATYSASGHGRLRNYDIFAHQMSLDIIQEFNGVDDGFDFSIESPDGVNRYWTPYYPRKGTRHYDLDLEFGGLVQDFTYVEDAQNLANLVYATGATSGGVKFENHSRDNTSAAYRGEFQAISSFGNEQDVDWLLAKAIQLIQRRKDPVIVPSLTCKDPSGQIIGNFVVGDSAAVYIDCGRIQIPGTVNRITKITWTPPDDTVLLDINDESVAS